MFFMLIETRVNKDDWKIPLPRKDKNFRFPRKLHRNKELLFLESLFFNPKCLNKHV